MPHAATSSADVQAQLLADQLRLRLLSFLAPLLSTLDRQLERRLVLTFVATLQALLIWRHRNLALLLSELGSYLAPPAHAPAGTKRLSNLLRSTHWQADLIGDELWRQAKAEVSALRQAGQHALLIWDHSVLEKAESEQATDFCSVRSSKARRLTRIRKGFFQPPLARRPICVAGMHWTGLLVSGLSGAPTVALMQWWTTRGERATERRIVAGQLLKRCRKQWGRQVHHVWDRGFASSQWLFQALEADLCFVLRWPKR
jgi:hypothetical protein